MQVNYDSVRFEDTGMRSRPGRRIMLETGMGPELDESRLLTVKRLAVRWGKSEYTIREYAKDKTIPAIKVVRSWLFSVDKIKQYEERNFIGVR